MTDPLKDLVVDERELAREELATVLRPFVRFASQGDVFLQPEFDRLTTIRRVACLLLAFSAAHLLGLRDRPGATPQEVVEASGMPPGTVRPKLTELLRLRVAGKAGGEYTIPSHALRRAAQLVGGADG